MFGSILKYKVKTSVTISDTTYALNHVLSAHLFTLGMAMETSKYNLIAICLDESCISSFLLWDFASWCNL